MMITTAVMAALASACGFALSNSLQHRVASATPDHSVSAGGLVRVLIRRPSWHLGVALGLAAVALQAVAVSNAPLFIVQPLVVTGIVMALPIRAALDSRLPSVDDVIWVTLTAAGIAAFVFMSGSGSSTHTPDVVPALALVLVGAAAAAAMSCTALRGGSAQRRGILLGAASGILSGLTAGTLKLAALHSAVGLIVVATVAGVLVLGACGFALNQRAYQVAPLALSLPVLNVVGVVVATAFGCAVFGEVPAHEPTPLVAEFAGLAVMGLGLTRLARRTPAAVSSDSRHAALDPPTPTTRLADWPTCETDRTSATVWRLPVHWCSSLSPDALMTIPTGHARSSTSRRRPGERRPMRQATRPPTSRPTRALQHQATTHCRWPC
jgi:hypothetical protein